MRYLLLLAVLVACGGDYKTTEPKPSPDPNPVVLLKDIQIPNLPSPFYHFAYNSDGRVSFASYASELFRYDVIYDGKRIKELDNNILVNHDRLEYLYDIDGRVSAVKYRDQNQLVFTFVVFTYEGDKLTGVERDRKVTNGFIIDKTMTLSYYPDGNVRDITNHRPAIDGVQEATTTVDHFEQYDAGINVDGFSLIHDDFFDHLILLPAVQIQKGNPRRVTHTGDGVNYIVDYTYAYDDGKRPRSKTGDLVFQNGADAGRHFQVGSVFTYY